MQSFNILFTSSGRRVSLLQLFRQALAKLGLPGQIIAADAKTTSPTSFVADVRETVPPVANSAYVQVLEDLCRKHDVRLVVPLIDHELHILAPYRDAFSRAGTTLLVSSLETARTCLDKRRTHRFFKRHGIPTPELLDPDVLRGPGRANFPLVIKPVTGSSSIGFTVVHSQHELLFYLDRCRDALVQEFVTGDEYTLDVLVDLQQRVRCVVPRLRLETRAGEISKGVTVKDPCLIEMGKRVVECLPGAVGCITVQCFLTPQKQIKLIEINPRFGGGFPLSARAGADYPRWIIEMVLGRDPDIALDGWQEGTVMLRYDEAIFVTRDMIT
jgi:carbamoyl-phosphate synthase large subunit